MVSNDDFKTLELHLEQIKSLFAQQSDVCSSEHSYSERAGLLSDVDVNNLIISEDIVITPFIDSNLSPIGYNLSFTKFIYSVCKDVLLKVERDQDTREQYVLVPPNDTILVLTNEAVWVSEQIAGTFHSKVALVSAGLGHIGTTLDPNWEGPLLISINNPTRRKVRLVISSEERGVQKYKTFATLIFYKMCSAAKGVHDNLPSRIDILKDKKNQLTKKRGYRELIDIIDKILNFESLHVGIGKHGAAKRSQKILEFKNKYSNFATSLNENITDAQRVSNKITRQNEIYYGATLLLVILPFVLLIDLAYSGYIAKDSNMLGLLAIVTAMYIWLVSFVESYSRSKFLV